MSNAQTRARAMKLCRRAEMSDDTEQRFSLALQAMSLWQESPEAQLVLADMSADPLEAKPHFEQALENAREVIGEEMIEEFAGELADREHGISYLRALDGLALVALHTAEENGGGKEQALEYLREMLRLDSDDHLGASHTLLAHLVAVGSLETDKEAYELTEEHPCECSQYLYSCALLAYRLGLDVEDAYEYLEEAILTDPYVLAFMLGAMELPEDPPEPEDIEEDETAEAAVYVATSYHAWGETEGALQWLHSSMVGLIEEIDEELIDQAMLDRIFGESEDDTETDTIRVLLADSEPVRQMGMRLILEASSAGLPGIFDPEELETDKGEGYRPTLEIVAMALDAGSASRAAADLAPDVAIVDVIMRVDAKVQDTEEFNGVVIPGGFSLAYNLKHGREDLGIEPMKVLLMGEYEDEAEPEHQLRYTEADGYVDARVSVGKLVDAVRRVCVGEEIRQSI